jgi:hypothetical protein
MASCSACLPNSEALPHRDDETDCLCSLGFYRTPRAGPAAVSGEQLRGRDQYVHVHGVSRALRGAGRKRCADGLSVQPDDDHPFIVLTETKASTARRAGPTPSAWRIRTPTRWARPPAQHVRRTQRPSRAATRTQTASVAWGSTARRSGPAPSARRTSTRTRCALRRAPTVPRTRRRPRASTCRPTVSVASASTALPAGPARSVQ